MVCLSLAGSGSIVGVWSPGIEVSSTGASVVSVLCSSDGISDTTESSRPEMLFGMSLPIRSSVLSALLTDSVSEVGLD